MSETIEIRFDIGSNGDAVDILGKHDENLKFIAKHVPAKIVARGNQIIISGEPEEALKVEKLFNKLKELLDSGNKINIPTINYAMKKIYQQKDKELVEALSEVISVTAKGKQIKPKSIGQHEYIKNIMNHDLVFGIGPAGTGKTYLAVVMAVEAFRNKSVHRIILARPAVEAGEKLGFLPGDLQDKVNPYLRPLYDGLYDVLGHETAHKFIEREIIEIAPLAYMRGRTLDDSFIILDEAQNTTPEQMKMFLTRIGLGSKAVVTGDITQIDLPKGDRSGLLQALEILSGIKGIKFQYLDKEDVVRHPLVQKIIGAYENIK